MHLLDAKVKISRRHRSHCGGIGSDLALTASASVTVPASDALSHIASPVPSAGDRRAQRCTAAPLYLRILTFDTMSGLHASELPNKGQNYGHTHGKRLCVRYQCRVIPSMALVRLTCFMRTVRRQSKPRRLLMCTTIYRWGQHLNAIT